MIRFLILLLLIYVAYKFYKVFIHYKRKVDALESELRRRKINEIKDTDYEEIK